MVADEVEISECGDRCGARFMVVWPDGECVRLVAALANFPPRSGLVQRSGRSKRREEQRHRRGAKAATTRRCLCDGRGFPGQPQCAGQLGCRGFARTCLTTPPVSARPAGCGLRLPAAPETPAVARRRLRGRDRCRCTDRESPRPAVAIELSPALPPAADPARTARESAPTTPARKFADASSATRRFPSLIVEEPSPAVSVPQRAAEYRPQCQPAKAESTAKTAIITSSRDRGLEKQTPGIGGARFETASCGNDASGKSHESQAIRGIRAIGG